MPQAGQAPDYDDVADPQGTADAVSAQRDVHIVPEPGAQ